MSWNTWGRLPGFLPPSPPAEVVFRLYIQLSHINGLDADHPHPSWPPTWMYILETILATFVLFPPLYVLIPSDSCFHMYDMFCTRAMPRVYLTSVFRTLYSQGQKCKNGLVKSTDKQHSYIHISIMWNICSAYLVDQYSHPYNNIEWITVQYILELRCIGNNLLHITPVTSLYFSHAALAQPFSF